MVTSKRNQPEEFVGDVAVYTPRDPMKNPYFRLKWTEPDGRPATHPAARTWTERVGKQASAPSPTSPGRTRRRGSW